MAWEKTLSSEGRGGGGAPNSEALGRLGIRGPPGGGNSLRFNYMGQGGKNPKGSGFRGAGLAAGFSGGTSSFPPSWGFDFSNVGSGWEQWVKRKKEMSFRGPGGGAGGDGDTRRPPKETPKFAPLFLERLCSPPGRGAHLTPEKQKHKLREEKTTHWWAGNERRVLSRQKTAWRGSQTTEGTLPKPTPPPPPLSGKSIRTRGRHF